MTAATLAWAADSAVLFLQYSPLSGYAITRFIGYALGIALFVAIVVLSKKRR